MNSETSKTSLLDKLNMTYSTISKFIDSLTLKLKFTIIELKKESVDDNNLFISESILFSHILEAMTYDLTRTLILEKYPILNEYMESIFQMYFVQFPTWIDQSLAEYWTVRIFRLSFPF